MEKKENKFLYILKRPLFKLVVLVVVLVILILVLVNAFGGKEEDNESLIGYQRLVNVSEDGKYTYIDLKGKTKKYSGYKTMSDFYYDVTNVSRENPDDTSKVEYALIGKNNSQVVKFGTYDNIIQVIGGKYYKIVKDNKFGIMSYDGKVLFEPKYDYISVITVQDGSEIIFECQAGDNYELINESGKVFLTTASKHDISYINRLNDSYDTIVKIGVDSENRYYDLKTGEELFENEKITSFIYNIVKQENKITIFGNDYKNNVTIDTSDDYSADAKTYFNKYVLVDQKNGESGRKYTVYDENLKVVLESDKKVNIIKAASGEIYFLTNEEEGLKIVNEEKKSKTVKGYEFNSNSISDLQAIVVNPIGDTSKVCLCNFKGKMLEENVSEYFFKGSSLKVTKNDGSSFLLFTNKSKYDLIEEDSISSVNDYLLVENMKNATTSIISNDGKVVLDRATGTKLFYNDDYIALQSDKTVNIYDVTTGKQTFSYNVNDYVDRYETANYVELTTGYYLFSGKLISEKK